MPQLGLAEMVVATVVGLLVLFGGRLPALGVALNRHLLPEDVESRRLVLVALILLIAYALLAAMR